MMAQRHRRWLGWLGAVGALAALVLAAGEALARPGGGQSYSGGGGFGGGGGGGGGEGGAGLVRLLLWLVIEEPQIGIPLTVVVAIGYVVVRRSNRKQADWDSGPPVAKVVRPDLGAIRRVDPDFSVVLFEDFVYRLFAQVHQARSSAEALDELAPYLSPVVRAQFLARKPAGVPVHGVVVGALRAIGLTVPPRVASAGPQAAPVKVRLEIEATYTAGDRTSFVVEHWELHRAATAVSKPPDANRRFPCPNCGAPFRSSDRQKCDYCGEIVNNGRFDWLVTGARLTHETSGPDVLTRTVEERGTDLPTIVDGAMERLRGEIAAADPTFTGQRIEARLRKIYDQLNQSWSGMDLSAARPFVSDGLFDYLQYWITAYRARGVRNALEGMRLERWNVAKIVRDKYLDSLTVRIWGTGRDTIVEAASGKVLSGNPRRDRAYSEYWTLIRSAGARSQAKSDEGCPNCGAELKINMAGTCDHCGAHVTSGEFDWVLGKIEQDDSYRG